MGDQAEIWAGWKKSKQEARAQRREAAPRALQAAGISFTTHNEGAHLIVESHLGYVDFWPGTGKWATRNPLSVSGFGLRTLIEYINPSFK